MQPGNVIEDYSSIHQVVDRCGVTMAPGQMPECPHPDAQRCILPVQRWAAAAVPLNLSGLTAFHEVIARQVAILLILTVWVGLAQCGSPNLQNAQLYHYDLLLGNIAKCNIVTFIYFYCY